MSNHLFVCQLTFSNFEKSAGNFITTEKEKLVTNPNSGVLRFVNLTNLFWEEKNSFVRQLSDFIYLQIPNLCKLQS